VDLRIQAGDTGKGENGAPAVVVRASINGRTAFTLIEMLVAIGILLTLATLTVAFLPGLTNFQKVQNSAGQVQGWLLTAKQRALRDQLPRGLRLLVDSDGKTVRQLQYIEQPEDITGGTGQPLTLSVVGATTLTMGGMDLAGGLDPGNNGGNLTLWPVQAGDFLFFDPPTSPNPCYKITGVTSQGQAPSNQITTNSNYSWTPKFAIIRGPRVLTGEPLLQLSRDIAIDVTPTTPGPTSTSSLIVSTALPDPTVSTNPKATYYDLMFGASGAITGVYYNTVTSTGTNSGSLPAGLVNKIVLWMHDVTQDTGVGTQVLVTIYTRTGTIAVHLQDTSTGASADNFSFTKDGKDSGM
jgi:prepilin-type N-terminal cleavage/methylation domain-containing protein